MQQVKIGLESMSYKPEIHELSWFQDDYGLKAGNEEDGEDDEDDDDEEGDDDDSGEEDED